MRPGPEVRPDVRLEDGPMQDVDCQRCGARVLARKSSWEQMTVQWSAAALATCAERSETLAPSQRPNRNAFAGCGALKETVRSAAVAGDLGVLCDEPLLTNPDHEGPAH